MGFFDVVNIYGLLFAIIMTAPHIVYARTHSYNIKSIENRAMVYIARIGKFCGVFLMAVNIGVLESGFTSELMKKFWLYSTAVLVAVYIVIWILFLKTNKKGFAYILTILAGFILMYCGLLQVKTLLLTAGIVYLSGELYVVKKML